MGERRVTDGNDEIINERPGPAHRGTTKTPIAATHADPPAAGTTLWPRFLAATHRLRILPVPSWLRPSGHHRPGSPPAAGNHGDRTSSTRFWRQRDPLHLNWQQHGSDPPDFGGNSTFSTFAPALARMHTESRIFIEALTLEAPIEALITPAHHFQRVGSLHTRDPLAVPPGGDWRNCWTTCRASKWTGKDARHGKINREAFQNDQKMTGKPPENEGATCQMHLAFPELAQDLPYAIWRDEEWHDAASHALRDD